MDVIDLTPEHESLYFQCLEDWSEEMKEAGGHKQRWYDRMKDKGLRVKLARDDKGVIGGMIHYIPNRAVLSPGAGEFQKIRHGQSPAACSRGGQSGLGKERDRGLGCGASVFHEGFVVQEARVQGGGQGWNTGPALEALQQGGGSPQVGPQEEKAREKGRSRSLRGMGNSDGLLIDGKQVRAGPPPSFDKIRGLIGKRVKNLR